MGGFGGLEFGLGMELVNPDKESVEKRWGETRNLKGRGWTFHAISGRGCEGERSPGRSVTITS